MKESFENVRNEEGERTKERRKRKGNGLQISQENKEVTDTRAYTHNDIPVFNGSHKRRGESEIQGLHLRDLAERDYSRFKEISLKKCGTNLQNIVLGPEWAGCQVPISFQQSLFHKMRERNRRPEPSPATSEFSNSLFIIVERIDR